MSKSSSSLKAASSLARDYETEEEQPQSSTANYSTAKIEAASRPGARKRESVLRLSVHPDECCLWAHHNRNQEVLDEESCADLIRGFKEAGQQEIPAIVRKYTRGDDYKYEIICGKRRQWVAQHLGWDLIVEIRDLTDEQAFLVSDVENRDRKDICDYDRALDYKNAVSVFYTNQKDMATKMGVDEAWLSRILSLAEFPQDVVQAYHNPVDIRTSHAKLIGPLLKHTKKQTLILAEAKAIKAEQEKLAASQKKPIPGDVVAKRLKAAGEGKRKRARKAAVIEVKTPDNKPFIKLTNRGGGQLSMDIVRANDESVADIVKAVKQAVEQALG